MHIIDKKGAFERVANGQTVALELGCGNFRRDPAAIGIDLMDYPSVDLVGDVFEVLGHFPDNSVERISSSHFMEHVSDLPRLLAELSRVLIPAGRIFAIVPHFSNSFYYSDPTHRSPFGLYTMAYFCEQRIFSRDVPSYALGVPMVLDKVHLRFKSIRPRYLSHAIKRFFGLIVNSSTWMMERYEENLCWIFPCYEIHMELHKKDAADPSAVRAKD